MSAVKEIVLYYTPEKTGKTRLLKGVLVRMGIRIKNIGPEQVTQKVGYLTGLKDYEEALLEEGTKLPVIPEEMLVLHGFTNRRLDEFLSQLRRAKVSTIALKAVVTDTNAGWSFYELYQEIRAEHEKMTEGREQNPQE